MGSTGHCVTLFLCVIWFGAVPDEAEVCNLCSLLKGNRSDFLLFWDDLEFSRIPQIPHDGIAVSYKFPVCATRTRVGTELREEVVVAYAVGLVSLTIGPFVSLYPAEFCWDVFIAVGGPSVPLSYVGLGHCMFGQSVAYAERFARHETPRPRSSSFRLVHAVTVYNGTVRGARVFMAATARITLLLSVVLVAVFGLPDVSPSMFLTA